MDEIEDIEELLKDYKEDEIDIETVKSALLEMPYKDLGEVKVDTFRKVRKGLPEAVFSPGKTKEQLENIAKEGNRFFTRASEEDYEVISSVRNKAEYIQKGNLIVVGDVSMDVDGNVVVVTAGSSDIPVAEETAAPLDHLGYDVERIFDVGVAGIHRLLPHLKTLRNSDGVIVVAGMDGTLPGIVAGLIGTPVIGVPTSVGYGVAGEGRSALNTMLNSCSTGLAVVNIDNGYGAASFIHHMLNGGKNE